MSNTRLHDHDMVQLQNVKTHDVFVTDANSAIEWVIQFEIFGKPINCKIDTGARCNIISTDTLNQLGTRCHTKRSDTVINGVHGKGLKSLGIVLLPCRYNGLVSNIEFEVLDGVKGLNLLGRFDCVKLGFIA